MPRDLLEVKDRMLHNGVYFCANYATWHYLALLGTIWQHWATKCHESSPLSSEPGPPASYCIIWFLYCAILRFPVFPCLSLFSLESTRLPPVSSCFFFVGVQWLQVVLLQAAILLGLLSNIWALLLGTAFCGVTYALLSPERSVEDQVSSSYRELPKRTGER